MREREVSGVWLYFIEDLEETRFANCKVASCSTKIPRGPVGSVRKSWSLKGLWEHLRKYHKAEYTNADKKREETKRKKTEEKLENERMKEIYDLTQKKQLTLQEAKARTVKWAKDSKEQKKNEENLITWMSDALVPYSAVENTHFKTLISGK